MPSTSRSRSFVVIYWQYKVSRITMHILIIFCFGFVLFLVQVSEGIKFCIGFCDVLVFFF
jgi:hypothetical protein